jgi:hypothetical protein
MSPLLLIGMTLALQAEPKPSLTRSGNEFLTSCSSTDPTQRVVCSAYVIGLWEGASPFYKVACLPTGVNYEQLLDVGIQVIRDNPRARHQPTKVLLFAAWMKTFPCPKAGTK